MTVASTEGAPGSVQANSDAPLSADDPLMPEGGGGLGADRAGAERVASFGDRLAERVAKRESQLVLGLDPDPAHLWPEAVGSVAARPGSSSDVRARPPGGSGVPAEPPGGLDVRARPPGGSGVPAEPPGGLDVRAQAPGGPDPPAVLAARAVARHCALVIEATAEYCVAVKPQVACFERLGAPGWAALAEIVALARERGLLVIADAKRGDIGVTAAAYAQAFLGVTPTPYGPVEGLGVDVMTVNPLLGGDSVEPFLTTARAHGRGLFVLVRTSNPGAADLQERGLADGRSVSDRLADLVDELGAAGIGRHGLSDVGAVVGATAPDRLAALRERMPRAPFLLPGVGAQGGRVEDLAPAFAAGRAGGLVSASRGIVRAHERAGGDPAEAAAREASRLRELAWRLST